jgi:RNase H-fold protein (predicted Holliday junction resolvase)
MKPPRKKRVRRIQIELAFYRRQVQELELRLKRLKLLKEQQPFNTTLCFNDEDGTSVWNGIAERQLKERLRAQKQQKELVDSQAELIKLETDLRKLLEKSRTRSKVSED